MGTDICSSQVFVKMALEPWNPFPVEPSHCYLNRMHA